MFRFLLITFFIFSMSAQTSFAQDAPVPSELLEEKIEEPETIPIPETPKIPERIDPNKKPLPFSSYDEIPQEALDDAQDFFEYCEKDTRLPTHYDCRCWSARYLEERIKMGPNVGRTSVMLAISKECHNIPGAAGFAHDRCLQYGSISYDGGMSPEEFCQCIGNNYALLLQQAEGFQMSTRNMNNLMTSATMRCKTPPPGVPNTFPRLDK